MKSQEKKNDYKEIDNSRWTDIPLDCPVCGGISTVYRYNDTEISSTVVVCCTNGGTIGPQTGIVNTGCLLYMPPNDFYRARMKDAINYWNEYAKSLLSIRNGQLAKFNKDFS